MQLKKGFWHPYLHYNKADEEFLKTQTVNLYRYPFVIKKAMSEMMATDLTSNRRYRQTTIDYRNVKKVVARKAVEMKRREITARKRSTAMVPYVRRYKPTSVRVANKWRMPVYRKRWTVKKRSKKRRPKRRFRR